MDLFLPTITSVVTTTTLLCAIFWISRTWIKERLSQSIKHEYDLDLEKYKSELTATNSIQMEKIKALISTEHEVIRSSLLRYSEKQFDLYNSLWSSLCDLEACVNDLWEDANSNKLRRLAKQIHDARIVIKKSALLIEENHYRELNTILDQFDQFKVGKQNLIDLRKINRENYFELDDIHSIIANNADIKNSLVALLGQMMACLKGQIVRTTQL